MDIGMEFGISTCTVLTLKRRKRVNCRCIELPDGERIENPNDDRYKYFGIMKLDNILHRDMYDKVIIACFKRLKLLMKSRLNSRNLATTFNI